MGIDLDKMRNKLNTLEKKGERKSDLFWRPSDGEQTIRIVPTPDGDPFREFWFHYDVGNNPGFLSPKKNFGEDDPLDSFVRQLWSEGSEDSIKMAKNLSARQRFFSPVIVRGEEEKGVRIWGYGKMAYRELLNLVLNPDYGDITDTMDGTDLVLTYGKPPGAQFPQTNLTPRRKTSRLLKTDDQINQALESIPDFSTIFDRKTPEDVQAMLDEFLLGEDGVEASSAETTKYNNAPEDKVDKAFADLLT